MSFNQLFDETNTGNNKNKTDEFKDSVMLPSLDPLAFKKTSNAKK